MLCCGGDEVLAHFIAVGICEADMGGDAVSEKSMLVSAAGAIDELVRDDDIAGCEFLFQ